MRNYLLFLSLLASGMLANAQQLSVYHDNKFANRSVEKPMVQSNVHLVTPPKHQHRSGSRSLGPVLNSQRIGSAGNLLSILDPNCNQIDVNDSLNTITFIHRNDPDLTLGTNVAQYRFDISKDLGNTWTPDIGPITNDETIDNVNVNGRFPQALIYNPAGNTIADSAYLIYSGTWHDNTTWSGQMRGRGKLSGDTATFNVSIDVVNNKAVEVATGLCHGAPGVFWNLNTLYAGNFTTSGLTTGFNVQKGVWNNTTKNVDWTSTNILQTFVKVQGTNALASVATSHNIAFDPTGQYGWISVLGDITPDQDSVYNPIFWKTVDFGANWTGPIEVDLNSLAGVVESLNPTWLNGDPSTLNPTTVFEADLTVDVKGNPHLLTTVGNGSGYSIEPAGYDMWDITFDSAAVNCGGWKGIHLAEIGTFRGEFTNDNPATTMDNRPLVSRSEDGHKVFFFWLETEIVDTTQDITNSAPNFFGRAIDVVSEKISPRYNFSEGDTLWGGRTIANDGGAMGSGVTFPTVSVTALKKGNIYNVPTVFTQIDYNNNPANGLGSSEQPAAFWYIGNIDFPASDFNLPLDPPTVTLNGLDTVTIRKNTSYTEDGATAFDCNDGNVAVVIVNSPDTAVVGIYQVLYIATDAAGNSDTAVRTVIVGDVPVADFNWTHTNGAGGNRVLFNDLSTNFPSNWKWEFGDGSGSIVKQPTVKVYNAIQTYNVCLTVGNTFGTSNKVCKDVSVTAITTGINDIELDQEISLFPNPSNGKAALLVKTANAPQLTVTVYNILGETIINPTTYKAGTTNIQLDLTSVSNGLYLVKIQSDKGATVKQLTVSK